MNLNLFSGKCGCLGAINFEFSVVLYVIEK